MELSASPSRSSIAARQRGQAAVIVLLLLTVGVSALLYNLVNPAKITIDQDKATANALAQAREALIGYATGQRSTGTFRPGELPCPDITGTGSEGASCNTTASRIGLLPWKTLGLPDPRDGSGERLWYAVSDVFKNATQTSLLNSDTAGDFMVTGTTPATSVIAIVFAPGAVLGSQNRSSSATAACATTGTTIARNLCADNYLEGGNSDGDTTFTTGLKTTTFNDKLLLITRDNFFPAVERRVAQEIASVLRSYYLANGYYPTPAQFPSNTSTQNLYRGYVPTTTCSPVPNLTFPTWFAANNWQQYLVYAVAPRCTPKITTGLVSLGSQPPCALSCIGPILGIYTCIMPDTIDATGSNCANTSAGPYLTVTGVSTSIESIVMPASYAVGAQPARPCNSAADCLEDAENTDIDNYTYVKPVRSTSNNDNLIVVRP